MNLYFDTDVQYIKGVGPSLAQHFHKKGIFSVKDLLTHYPRTYMEQKGVHAVSSLKEGEDVCFQATILKVRSFFLGRSHRKGYEVVLADSTGKISGFFFRLPYKNYFDNFTAHQKVKVTGKVVRYRGRLQFQHPLLEVLKTKEAPQESAVLALYSEIDNISNAKLKKIIDHALNHTVMTDHLPSWIKSKYSLISLKEALVKVHQPEKEEREALLSYKTPAQKRIIFDEFFWVELKMALRKNKASYTKGFPMKKPQLLRKEFIKSLPFELTEAQKRVDQEIQKDLTCPRPMHRLLQGDVGSGKTVVAFLASLTAYENNLQTCFMAPTEILAQQHYQQALKFLKPLGLNVAFLTSQLKPSEKKDIYEKLQQGAIHLCIGTHALLQEPVQLAHLGLVLIDEQHRFGVHQRGLLLEKNKDQKAPHFLVMTATPIPRTLAMTVYADLDICVLDEKPKGRKPIVTRKVFYSQRERMWSFLEKELKKGRQAYVIYPLIEESEKMDLRNAQDECDKLTKRFHEHRVQLLHGKMKPEEKQAIMKDFQNQRTQVLVSTTVVEVGVDVPNASLMVVEHSERFGLSQLHQLRGRVGRGPQQSHCFLSLGYALSQEAIKRAQVIEETQDGFKIAEEDLQLRGPGEFLGTKQSGLAGFKMAHLLRDTLDIATAKKAAFELIQKDPHFLEPQNKEIKKEFEKNIEPLTAG